MESIVNRLYEIHKYEDKSLEDTIREATRQDLIKKNKEFRVGDIVYSKYYSARVRKTVPKHPILVITRVEKGDDYVQYEGLPLKSVHREEGKVDKSNKNKNGGFPNSIYINNYSSILIPGEEGVAYPASKESFMDVQDLARFRSYDIETSRYAYGGHVTDEFLRFANTAYMNYRNGKDNSNLYWEK